MNVNYSVGSVGAPMGGYKDSSYYSYLQKIQQNNTEQQTKSAHNKRSQGVEINIPVKYGEYEIKNMMFVAPVVSYGKRIISVVTCNGRTVITRHEMREC